MARLFDDVQSEYLAAGNAVLTTEPFVMACWFNSDDAAADQSLMILSNPAGDRQFFELLAMGAVVGDPVRARIRNDTTGKNADTSSGFSANTWHHACGIWAAADDRRVLIDGGSKGTETTSVADVVVNKTAIGVRNIATIALYMSGRIAEAAIWDLSDWPGATDVDKANNFEALALPSLAKGFSPKFFSLGLKAYWPLIRDEDNDIIGGYNMIPANTPSIGSHPRIIYPTASRIIQTPVISGAADGGKFGILFEMWGW